MKKICPKCNCEWEGYSECRKCNPMFSDETSLKKEIRMAVTYACTYVWEQTLLERWSWMYKQTNVLRIRRGAHK
jgi:hypothetical protein